MTLAERIEWVLKHRKEIVINESRWSVAAHLARQHVNTMRRRLAQNPDAEQERGTLEALADAAKVSRAWFALGEGTPDAADVVVERDERYHQMKAVREMGLSQGFDPSFVEKWEPHLDADEQPDADYLWTLMKAAWARHQRKLPPQGDPFGDIDKNDSLHNARKKR